MLILVALLSSLFFFFNDTATTEIYTLSLHDALPICSHVSFFFYSHALEAGAERREGAIHPVVDSLGTWVPKGAGYLLGRHLDRKSTRLNSSHSQISYAVFCLKKKNHLHLVVAHARGG